MNLAVHGDQRVFHDFIVEIWGWALLEQVVQEVDHVVCIQPSRVYCQASRNVLDGAYGDTVGYNFLAWL